jgi:branched-subunit amino acid ABC-type transport system permease component/ABC-type branched-subunit amino acid transport system ATPase component
MTELLNLLLSGLVTGAIYSVMASGLVLTYTTSGIFNFAHGAIAFTTAYLYYQLNSGVGLPIVPSLVISVVVFAPALGLLLDRVLLRRLAKAPVYARVVGTIGLLVLLPNLTQWVIVTLFVKVFGWNLPGNDGLTTGVPIPGIGPSPAHVYKPLRGVVLTSDQLAALGVSALAALLLWFVIRHTRLGLEMRAVVDREPLAGLRGVNARRTSAVAWVMTMLLAGLGGVLIAPLFTLDPNVYTLVVLGSLAVVVLGGLRSIPIAFVGGLGLGVVQNLIAGYSNDFLPKVLSNLTGLKASVPFILVIVLLLVFGRDRSRRGGSVAEDAPRPDHRKGMSPLRRRLPWALWTIVLVAYSQDWIGVKYLRADTYAQTVLANGLAVAVIFLSFVVVTGVGGMVSLAQAAFVTIGGVAAGWALERNWNANVPGIVSHGHLNFLLAMVIGAAVAGAVGMLMAWPIAKLGGVSLALGTLAFAFVCALVIFPIQSIGHGQAGWTIPAPSLSIPGLNWLHDLVVVGDSPHFNASQLPDQILLFLVVFGLITLAIHAFMRSSSGRAMLAIRSSEVAAEASGIRVNRTKVLVFGLSAAIAGVGGILLGLFSFSVSQATAPPLIGLFWLALAVTFGIRRPGGALLAGLAYTGGAALFHWIGGVLPGGSINALVTSDYFVPMLSGLGAITLAQEPDGLLALVGHRRVARQQSKRRPSAAQVVSAPPIGDVLSKATETTAAFELRDIVGGYHRVDVVHRASLSLEAGTVTALLGANGAGKSTLCAIAAGLLTPTAGTVWLGRREVGALPTFQRARDGVLLVPEARGIFPGLTVEENLALVLRSEELREQAYARFRALGERRRQVAGLLSGGEQQMLSIAPALVSPPTVLIADEPTLGLAPLLADMVMDAILEIRSLGSAVLLVEEHAENALKVADVIAFMELGRVTWMGPRRDVDMSLLVSAYMGSQAPRVERIG